MIYYVINRSTTEGFLNGFDIQVTKSLRTAASGNGGDGCPAVEQADSGPLNCLALTCQDFIINQKMDI